MNGLINKYEVMIMLGCSEKFLRGLEDEGLLKRVRIGKRFVRYQKADVEKLIQQATETKTKKGA